jgi:predicted metal-dependent hydrolase
LYFKSFCFFIDLFKRVSNSYITKAYEFKLGDYNISFYHKYADEKLNSEFPMFSLVWDENYKLKHANGAGVFDIKDYSTVKINKEKIKENLHNFYKKLNKTIPDYVLDNISEIWRSSVYIT